MMLLSDASPRATQIAFPLIAGVGLGMLFHAPYQVFTRALRRQDVASGTSAFFLVRFTGATVGLVSTISIGRARRARCSLCASSFAQAVAGGERLAVVCNTGGAPERELTYLTLLQRQRAAAVVLTGGAIEDAAHQAAMAAKLRRLAEAGTRVVLCGRPPAPETGAVALTFDHTRAESTLAGREARDAQRATVQQLRRDLAEARRHGTSDAPAVGGREAAAILRRAVVRRVTRR